MSKLAKSRRAPRRALIVLLAIAAAFALLVSLDAEAGTPGRTADVVASPRAALTTTTAPTVSSSDGQIAYATPTGDVVVAKGDGSSPVTVGHGAVSNRVGLTPMAWRQPAADAITYVRKDGALVDAPTDGSAPRILATDAVVPPDVDENILSWDISGSFLIYLAQAPGNRIESHVVDLTEASDTKPPAIRTIGNPERRTVIAQAFSPLDPIIYQKTADPDTGRQFTVAVVEPFKGTIFGSRFSFDDVTFSPDGRYIFAVSSGNGNVQQLVRVSMRRPTGVDLVSDHDRVCRPSVSPDARTIVFAAGAKCQEVWTINSDGTLPKRIVKSVSDGSSFDQGTFSWSPDSRTITHADCRLIGTDRRCSGGYWDISVDGRRVTQRAAAGSVLRETRPLLRPVKVSLTVTGPIAYSGHMQVGVQSAGNLLSQVPEDVIQVKAIDDANTARSFEIKAVHPPNSVYVAGTLRVIDNGIDETFPFFGRILPYSLGYARLRGIWTRSEKLPFRTGQLVLTVER